MAYSTVERPGPREIAQGFPENEEQSEIRNYNRKKKLFFMQYLALVHDLEQFDVSCKAIWR